MKVSHVERGGRTGVVDVRALESVDAEVLQRLGLDPRPLYVL